jgi:hypothetical protein
LLLSIAAFSGFNALHGWQGPAFTITNELYVPSVMFATGHGFINPPVDEVPGLRDFLYAPDGEAVYTPGELPSQFSSVALDTYQRYHRYLVLAMGGIWWMLGVSWGSAKFLAVAFYLASVAGVYLCFRLAMNWRWSLVGALVFALSDLALDNVFNIREFSKVPFLILAIGLMGMLISRKLSIRKYLLFAALLGFMVGAGTGFRRDVMTALPPALLCMALAGLTGPLRNLRVRAAGMALFILVFVITSSPVLFALYERGSAVYHDALMGMATLLDSNLALRPADYNRIPVKQDFYITVAASALARDVFPGDAIYANIYYDTPSSKTRMYFMHWATAYPADMILRGAAATLAISRGIGPQRDLWPGALSGHISLAGPFYALFALYLLARSLGIRRSVLLVVTIGYFCVITSLQFEVRHVLHLGMLPLGFILLTWSALIRGIARMFTVNACPPDGASAGRALVFTAAVLATPILVWALALPLQMNQVRELEAKLENAALEPVQTRAVTGDDWTWYVPSGVLEPAIPDPADGTNFARPHYFMLELEAGAGVIPLALLFDASSLFVDYSMVVGVDTGADPRDLTVRYYFNAPECIGDSNYAHFQGLGLNRDHASRFKGLFRVDLGGRFDSPPNCTLAEGQIQRRFQMIDPWYIPPNIPLFAVDKFPSMPQ